MLRLHVWRWSQFPASGLCVYVCMGGWEGGGRAVGGGWEGEEGVGGRWYKGVRHAVSGQFGRSVKKEIKGTVRSEEHTSELQPR